MRFSDRSLIYELRPYQKKVIGAFNEKINDNSGKFHVVAPPGAGKTILGISLLLESNQRGVVFSPNSAIQSQWIKKFYASTDILHFNSQEKTEISANVNDLQSYLSLTYQSITIKDRITNKLHKNAKTLISKIKENGYKTFIFDECHHLTGFWAEVLSELVESIPDALIISLTATPPLEADKKQLEKYLNLIGDIDIEIPLPAIVKQGNLAPYQDLIYITEPTENEIKELVLGEKKLNDLLLELDIQKHPRISLSAWIHECLENCKIEGKITSFEKQLKKKPDKLIAYVRYINDKKIEIPLSVPLIDEMEDFCNLQDLVLILEDYIAFHLEKIDSPKEYISRIVNTVSDLGYAYVKRKFKEINTGAIRNLTLSKNKIVGMKDVLKKEMDNFDDKLRVLILADFEFGRNHEDDLTCLDIINALTSDDKTDELDPIMLTGKSVLVDDDLLPLFMEKAQAYTKDHFLDISLEATEEFGYMRIDGKGKDWNTRTYVSMITEMLESGITKALVSTRSLLGEGWDAVQLNTLIDLTVISSYVSVNQIRGRTIRKDPQNSFKCANNWDIVTIHPGIHYGLHDLKRLEKKHAHFYGISDDNVIEKGLGHIHPMFLQNDLSTFAAKFLNINKDMLNRSTNRLQIYEAWGVGESYKDRDITSLELLVDSKKSRVVLNRNESKKIDWMKVELESFNKSYNKNYYGAVAIASVILGLSLAFIPIPVIGIIGAAVPLIACSVSKKIAKGKLKNKLVNGKTDNNSFEDILILFGKTVLSALIKCTLISENYTDKDIQISIREEDCYRLLLKNSNSSETKIFADSVWELFSTIQNHKYIIERHNYTVSMNELTERQIIGIDNIPSEVIACHPVPSIFCMKKEYALKFKEAWNEFVSYGELHYTRHGKGKEMVSKWLYTNSIKLRRERKVVWE